MPAKKNSPKAKEEKIRLPSWAMYASIGLLVVLVLAVYLAARLSKPQGAAAANYTPHYNENSALPEYIPAKDAYTLYNLKSISIIDVRPAGEFERFHIEGSINIPGDKLADDLAKVPHSSTILVVDGYGSESAANARKVLLDADFPGVTCLEGGLDAWAQAGYPLVGLVPY